MIPRWQATIGASRQRFWGRFLFVCSPHCHKVSFAISLPSHVIGQHVQKIKYGNKWVHFGVRGRAKPIFDNVRFAQLYTRWPGLGENIWGKKPIRQLTENTPSLLCVHLLLKVPYSAVCLLWILSVVLRAVSQLPRSEESPSIASFTCSTFHDACAKTQGSGNLQFVMSERALASFPVKRHDQAGASCTLWDHPVFISVQTCGRSERKRASEFLEAAVNEGLNVFFVFYI